MFKNIENKIINNIIFLFFMKYICKKFNIFFFNDMYIEMCIIDKQLNYLFFKFDFFFI